MKGVSPIITRMRTGRPGDDVTNCLAVMQNAALCLWRASRHDAFIVGHRTARNIVRGHEIDRYRFDLESTTVDARLVVERSLFEQSKLSAGSWPDARLVQLATSERL